MLQDLQEVRVDERLRQVRRAVLGYIESRGGYPPVTITV